MYIHTHTYMHVYIYIYIYVCICIHRERRKKKPARPRALWTNIKQMNKDYLDKYNIFKRINIYIYICTNKCSRRKDNEQRQT